MCTCTCCLIFIMLAKLLSMSCHFNVIVKALLHFNKHISTPHQLFNSFLIKKTKLYSLLCINKLDHPVILFIVIVQGIIEAPLKQNFTVFDAYIVCDYISSNHFLTQKIL